MQQTQTIWSCKIHLWEASASLFSEPLSTGRRQGINFIPIHTWLDKEMMIKMHHRTLVTKVRFYYFWKYKWSERPMLNAKIQAWGDRHSILDFMCGNRKHDLPTVAWRVVVARGWIGWRTDDGQEEVVSRYNEADD